MTGKTDPVVGKPWPSKVSPCSYPEPTNMSPYKAKEALQMGLG